MRGSHGDMRMCPWPGCKKCPDDGLSCAVNKKTKKFSDSAAAAHMKTNHKPQLKRSQAEWRRFMQGFPTVP